MAREVSVEALCEAIEAALKQKTETKGERSGSGGRVGAVWAEMVSGSW